MLIVLDMEAFESLNTQDKGERLTAAEGHLSSTWYSGETAGKSFGTSATLEEVRCGLHHQCVHDSRRYGHTLGILGSSVPSLRSPNGSPKTVTLSFSSPTWYFVRFFFAALWILRGARQVQRFAACSFETFAASQFFIAGGHSQSFYCPSQLQIQEAAKVEGLTQTAPSSGAAGPLASLPPGKSVEVRHAVCGCMWFPCGGSVSTL